MDIERSPQSQLETNPIMIPEPSLKDSTASIMTSDSRKPGNKLIRRVTDSIRRRFSRNDKRNASPLQPSSSFSSLPTASTVLVDGPASSKDTGHFEKQDSDHGHYRQSVSDTLSTSSTIVAEPELPKQGLVVSGVKTSDSALDDSLTFSVIQSKEAIEADLPSNFTPEIPPDLDEAAKIPLPHSPLPVAHIIIIEPPTPQIPEATIEEMSDLPQDHEPTSTSNPSFSGENPSVPEDPPSATTPLESTEPLSPSPPPPKSRDGPPRPSWVVTGLATLFMFIPIPHIRFGIRALPLSLIFLWYLLQC
jgi:hypothetical protein